MNHKKLLSALPGWKLLSAAQQNMVLYAAEGNWPYSDALVKACNYKLSRQTAWKDFNEALAILGLRHRSICVLVPAMTELRDAINQMEEKIWKTVARIMLKRTRKWLSLQSQLALKSLNLASERQKTLL